VPASKAATASATLRKCGAGAAASGKEEAPAATRSDDWRRWMTAVGISISGGSRGGERARSSDLSRALAVFGVRQLPID
jgi:hypothetical protein